MTSRLAAVLLLAGCFNPVAEPCKSKTRCPADGGAAICSVGSTRECGTSVGICKPGRQTCGPDGAWGRCIGGVVPGVEQCDGLDNDCNGMVDEGVGKMCPLQKGVCAGAAGSCATDAGCATAYGPSYQLVESACDGLDNDCDGVVDRSVRVNVSQSPGVVSRAPVAVKTPGSEGALVLYEEGDKVAARVVAADGTVSAAVAPSTTVESATRAFAPALAVSGAVVVGAWVEEAAGVKQVMVATLDPATGRSNLTGQVALPAFTVTTPTQVAVAVDDGNRLVVMVVDAAQVRVRGFAAPAPMGGPTYSHEMFFPGRHVSLAPAGSIAFGVDHADGRVLRGWLDSAGAASFDREQPMGANLGLTAIDGGLVSAYLSGTGMAKRVIAERCRLLPGDVDCVSPAALNPPSDSSALKVSGLLAAWQDGVSAPTVTQCWVDRPDAGQSLGPGRRPAPVGSSTLASVFFDTEGVPSAMVQSDEVYLVRSCR